jgi:hypothetical protein
MKTKGSIVYSLALIAVTAAMPALAANSLDVTGAAAIDGAFGLAVTMDGSTNKAFVRDFTPDGETVYRATFKIDMNNLAMNTDDWHFIATFRADDTTSARNLMRIIVRYKAGDINPYKIRFIARNDDKSWAQPGGHSLPTSGVSTITVEWQAATGPGANNGIGRFYRNGILRAQVTNLDNDTWNGIGSAQLGVDQVDPGTVGTIYYDSFESFRTLLP